jgi:DTW domain-containing protein YfiP
MTIAATGDGPAIDNRVAVLILQHPQEQDEGLGTARLTVDQLANATLRVGLSWPSLAKALGRPADPKGWATLYLGSADPGQLAPGHELVALDAKGALLADQEAALAGIEGVILLDGTWSQAKTLWWRNAWLLKSRRIVLARRTPSLYGKLRREPRREALSTIEAAALLLSRLEGRPEIETTLNARFRRMLQVYRDARKDEAARAAET